MIRLDARMARSSGEAARLRLQGSARLRRYRQYQDFYEGRHFERARNGRSNLVLNYARAVVDKGVAYLMGRGIGFSVIPRQEGSARDRRRAAEAEQLLYDVAWDNDVEGVDLQIAQNASVLGDGVYKVLWEPGSGRIRILSVDPRTFFGVWAGDDPATLRRVEAVYCLGADDLALGGYGLSLSEAEAICDGDGTAEVVERWTPSELEIVVGRATTRRGPNPYGFIPFVHVPNLPLANEPWGQSDLVDVIPINREIDERVSDAADVIRFHADPPIVFRGVTEHADLGGEPGTRIVERLGMTASPDTLLRLIRRVTVPEQPAPRVLGVDDWAFRKGHRYGTILVDLEQHQIVDVLPARSAEPVVEWLQAHPGVEIVSRDRAPAYAEAARKGAPQAVQVADRWHLIQNLVEALERCLLRFRPALKVAAGAGDSVLGPLPSSSETDLVPWQQRAEAASQQRHASKVELYEQMRTLRDAGFTVLDIAQLVGATRRTVYRYLALGGPPERQQPRRSGRRVLAPYEPYLIQRWAEGCRNRSRLFREIRLLGYQHSGRTVSLFLKRLEQEPSASTVASPRPTVSRVPSARRVASLLVWHKDQLPEEEREYLRRLCDQEPTIAHAYELAQEFADMARERTGQRFDAWLTRVTISGIPELDRFARGLTDDRAAVEAALTLEWSNGQTEGQVNKVKLLKRSMYGRANFDLLRLRLVYAA